jgi:diguanylate cyclase (GGDEF)-like protein/PAS domain S-box-containing protein
MLLFGKKNLATKLAASVTDQIEDAIVIIDSSHRIVYYNDSARRMFGYTEEEAMGQMLDILVPSRFHLQHSMMVDEFGAGHVATRHMGQRSRQIFGRRKDDSEFLASIQIMKVEDNGRQYYAAIIRDISENKRTEEELLRLAATDPLTGAFNRREFTSIADREALRSSRYHHALSILMFDIDYFKRLNDTYGHAAGDKALQRFTTLCCNALRNVDIFGRWGGEEFVALLPETDIEGASIIAERLRKIVNDNVLVYNEQKINFTVSIGVAQYKDGETTIDAPLGRADSAVYDAKKTGRNRISVYRN